MGGGNDDGFALPARGESMDEFPCDVPYNGRTGHFSIVQELIPTKCGLLKQTRATKQQQQQQQEVSVLHDG
jgi:hypothetical protein